MIYSLFFHPQFAGCASCGLIYEGTTGRRCIKSTKHLQRRILHLFDSTKFQDTLTLCGINGRPAPSLSYLFFASGHSRDTILLSLSIPSCRNGMVTFDATPSLPPLTTASAACPTHWRNGISKAASAVSYITKTTYPKRASG